MYLKEINTYNSNASIDRKGNLVLPVSEKYLVIYKTELFDQNCDQEILYKPSYVMRIYT